MWIFGLGLLAIVISALEPGAWQAIGAVAVAAVTAAGSYALGRMRHSGSVERSTAAELWAESTRIRQDQAKAIRRQDRVIDRQNGVIERLTDRVEHLEAEVARLQGPIHG